MNMTDWKKILEEGLERLRLHDSKPEKERGYYEICVYFVGKYLMEHDADTEPMCIKRAHAFEYAFSKLPVTFPDCQMFFGGKMNNSFVFLPEWLSKDEYDAGIAKYREYGERYFRVGWDHTIPDYETLLAKGLGDYIRRAEDGQATAPTPEREAMLISLKTISSFFLRAADGCAATRPVESERLRHLATNPPRDLADAMQLIWLIFVLLEAQGRHHMAFGRIDQYLYPFYKNSGLSHEQVLDMFCQLWALIETYHETTNICIGGCTPQGEDAVNDLSYIALEATNLVHSPSTNLSARFGTYTPEKFLLACAELIKTGIGFPAVFNDGVDIPMFTRLGFPVEDARNYALVGCVEAHIPGCQVAWSDGRFSMPACFMEALRKLPECKSYEELWDAFDRAMHKNLAIYRDNYNKDLTAFSPDRYPDPMLSALQRDCIARGKDINNGGSLYPRLHGIGMIGLANITDSLAAIKKLVFEEKRIAPEELLAALDANFEGYENMRQMLMTVPPKYGNDNDYCDVIATDVVRLCGTASEDLRTIDGGYLQSCMASNISNIPAGREVGATPDGRRFGTPLSDAASPGQGRDKKGPTAFVNSIVKPDYAVQNCTVVNMRFHPSMFANEDGSRNLMAVLKRFIEGKGHEMQFNVTDNETLQKALDRPEEYSNLIVRVSGFSAFFTRLSPEVQKDIMRRNAHTL